MHRIPIRIEDIAIAERLAASYYAEGTRSARMLARGWQRVADWLREAEIERAAE